MRSFVIRSDDWTDTRSFGVTGGVMKASRVVRVGLLVVCLAVAAQGSAVVGAPLSGSRLEDDGAMNSGKETHSHHAQHGEDHGHLPPVQRNVDLIGFSDLFAAGEQPGRIGDVSAKGNYAYLTLYYEPECDRGGIQIVDISDPANPKAAGYIPSHIGPSRARDPRWCP
jgi:hypothetical protein